MSNIPMVDLIGQYQKIKPEIENSFRDICNSAQFIGGSYVEKFCEDLAGYLHAGYVIPCANGTDALQLALMALDLKRGDEVITTPFTFVATAEVIALLGLKVKFVDVAPDTFNIDPELLAEALTPSTDCVIPVHLFGQSADMKAILDLCRDHQVHIVEDNAQSIGCTYDSGGVSGYTGAMGDMGTLSFFPSKNLGCFGDGGAVITNDPELARKTKMVANHGSDVRYHHDIIGVNSRLDNLQAAVLHAKLPHLESYNEKRREAAHLYNERLAGIESISTPVEDGKSYHVYHQYTLRVRDRRDELVDYLRSNGVSCAVYYPIPLHLQTAYKALGYQEGDFPVSERLCREVLSLPIHSEMTEEIVDNVTSKIRAFYA